MPRAGWLEHLALEQSVGGVELAKVVCKRIEERMIRDQPDLRHIYVECAPASAEQALVEAIGFRPLLIEYGITKPGKRMTVMRKRLDDELIEHSLDRFQLESDLQSILATVHGRDRGDRPS